MKIRTLAAIFLFTIGAKAAAAEYIIRPGDSLWTIGNKIGFSRKQLMLMNNISDQNRIFIDQKLIYFSKKDIESANKWCQKRINELKADNEEYGFYEQALILLRQGKIKFSHLEPNEGVHFNSLLLFSKAWNVSN